MLSFINNLSHDSNISKGSKNKSNLELKKSGSKNQSQDKIQKIEIESKQVNTIEKQNSRNKSQDKNQNQRKEIIKEEKSNQGGRNSKRIWCR